MSIRVLLADDHRLLTEGIASLLTEYPDLVVVGFAQDGQSAVRLAEELFPDVVVMDIRLSGLSGIDAARQISLRCPGTAVVALSSHAEGRLVAEMFRAGAAAYVPKHGALEDLVEAIRTVHSGAPRPGLGIRVDHRRTEGEGLSAGRGGLHQGLSDREREVLRMVADGRSNGQIAGMLNLSPHTVVRHRQNISGKLGLHTVADLTRFAVREGLVVA